MPIIVNHVMLLVMMLHLKRNKSRMRAHLQPEQTRETHTSPAIAATKSAASQLSTDTTVGCRPCSRGEPKPFTMLAIHQIWRMPVMSVQNSYKHTCEYNELHECYMVRGYVRVSQ
jgi:hypothetical protein